MTEPTNGDIMRALGGLEANFTNVKETIQNSDQRASESRRVLHEKIEDLSSVVHNVAVEQSQSIFQLKVTTDIAVQARDKIDGFIRKYEKEAAPILEGVNTFRTEAEPILAAVRDARNWVLVVAGALGTSGLTVVAVLAFANQWAKALILAWLNSS